jgi:hypothetical protein
MEQFHSLKEAPIFDLAAIQAALRSQNLDGWLLYDFAAATSWVAEFSAWSRSRS